jgi:DNA-binding IclR family transcriptional regulator
MAQPEAWHVARTMRALELLAFAPLSAPQLALAMQAHPRTVRRLLRRLELEDWVRRTDDVQRRYEPTMRMVALAGQIVENSPLARRARPYVVLLHEQTGAAAHIAVPSYQSVLCLAHHAPDAAELRPHLREVIPAHCTAGGKALLAERERWRESILATKLERYTDRTVVDPEALRRQLAEVRRRGHAIEDGEYQDGVRAVAAPVHAGGDAVAALTASGAQLDLKRSAERVAALAGQLTEDLREDPS